MGVVGFRGGEREWLDELETRELLMPPHLDLSGGRLGGQVRVEDGRDGTPVVF